MDANERKRADRIMVVLGFIAGLLAVIAVELGGVDYALYVGFEVETEQVASE